MKNVKCRNKNGNRDKGKVVDLGAIGRSPVLEGLQGADAGDRRLPLQKNLPVKIPPKHHTNRERRTLIRELSFPVAKHRAIWFPFPLIDSGVRQER